MKLQAARETRRRRGQFHAAANYVSRDCVLPRVTSSRWRVDGCGTAPGGGKTWLERRKDLGRKLIRVITVASHLGHRSSGLEARHRVPSQLVTRELPQSAQGLRNVERVSPGVVLRRHTSDVSPFEHAPALITSESAFN